jgi:hypothetical protein
VKLQFGRLAFIDNVDQYVGLGGVAILQIVWRELIVPFEIPCPGIERENAVSVKVVAGTVTVVAVRSSPSGHGLPAKRRDAADGLRVQKTGCKMYDLGSHFKPSIQTIGGKG